MNASSGSTQNPAQLLIRLNSLISKLTRSHQNREALHLFTHIHSSHHLIPDHYSLAGALTACANLRANALGTQLHGHAVRSGLQSHPHIANSILSFYAKTNCPETTHQLFDEIPTPDVYSCTTLLSAYARSGHVRRAFQLFDQMHQRDVPLWNAVITGCVEHGYRDLAFELFFRMHGMGVGHDHYTYASVLSLCDSQELLSLGRQVHSMVVRTGFVLVRVSVVNALISMYFNCGVIGDAYALFREASTCNQITYNAIIAGMVRWGRDEESVMMFKEMLGEACFGPTQLTLVSVLSACRSKELGGQVHALAIKTGLDNSVLVGNAAVTMYSTCGDLINARLVFERIDEKDIVTWNSMISGYSLENCHESAIAVYHQMQKAGIEPDDFTYGSLLSCSKVVDHAEMILALAKKNGLIVNTQVCNALISAFVKYGEIQRAYRIFCDMLPRNLISWNSILSGCVLNGHPMKGLELFSALVKSELKPNSYTISIVLSICASMSALRHGKEVHAYILRSCSYSETWLENALISMYAKCGVLDWCSRVFCRMSVRDVVSWNAMLAAYAQHGDGGEALCCFKTMQDLGVDPDQITFTIILSACSHAGFVDEGHWIFSSMIEDYGIEPGVDHYSCVIDLLARAGHLDEAERLINSMPHRLDSRVWWALLSACSTHGNVRLGRIAAEFLLEIEPGNPAVYVLLSNVNATAGQWEEASSTREQMRESGVMKQPGCSWI